MFLLLYYMVSRNSVF